jgi:hypothetical protein
MFFKKNKKKMRSSIEDNICAGKTPIKVKAPLRRNNTRSINWNSNLLTTIIIVPLHEILDNIYQLLSHSPTCQSSRAFTPVQNILHQTKVFEPPVSPY